MINNIEDPIKLGKIKQFKDLIQNEVSEDFKIRNAKLTFLNIFCKTLLIKLQEDPNYDIKSKLKDLEMCTEQSNLGWYFPGIKL